jgi:hypothetical protein
MEHKTLGAFKIGLWLMTAFSGIINRCLTSLANTITMFFEKQLTLKAIERESLSL